MLQVIFLHNTKEKFMVKYKAELFLDQRFDLAESPFYDERYDRLSWVNITEGELYTMENGDITKTSFGQMIGAAVPLPDRDGFIVAATDALYIYEKGEKKKLFDLTGTYAKYQRSNDAKLDPAGRLFFGSVVFDEEHEHEGKLYSYENGQVTVIQEKTLLSNGMGWNRNEDRFFFSDSDEHAVFAYDYNKETGEISGRRRLFEVEGGVPDGMCMDSKDNIWLAVWGGNRLECHDSSSGEQIAQIDVDAAQVSSCCFYKGNDRMFITTAGTGRDGRYDGCLFECKLG